MLVLRSALSPQHKDSWQSLWVAKYGNLDGFPWEEIGIPKPVFVCEHCGRANYYTILKGSE